MVAFSARSARRPASFWRWLAVLAVASAVVVGTTSPQQKRPNSSGAGTTPSTEAATTVDPVVAHTALDPGVDHSGRGWGVESLMVDIESYWSGELPRLYDIELDPVLRAVPYQSSEEATLPACNGIVREPLFYAENAFYCRLEHVIIYDDELLVPRLRDDYGPMALGVLFAHEYGHAIQAQAGVDVETVDIELQADCFAGAWASRHLGNYDIGSSDEVTSILRSLGDFSDPNIARDAASNSTADDRPQAFSIGLSSGASTCLGGLDSSGVRWAGPDWDRLDEIEREPPCYSSSQFPTSNWVNSIPKSSL